MPKFGAYFGLSIINKSNGNLYVQIATVINAHMVLTDAINAFFRYKQIASSTKFTSKICEISYKISYKYEDKKLNSATSKLYRTILHRDIFYITKKYKKMFTLILIASYRVAYWTICSKIVAYSWPIISLQIKIKLWKTWFSSVSFCDSFIL